MKNEKLEELIKKLSIEYPFATDEQREIVRKEYNNSSKPIEEIEKELLERIKGHVIRIRNSDATVLTDFASYHLDNNFMHIHLIPKSLLPYMRDIIKAHGNKVARIKYNEFLMSKLDEAMIRIADIMNADERIKTVSATSELVETYKDLFEKAGFVIKPFTDEELFRMFPNIPKEERERYRYNACINRAQILAKYSTELVNVSKNNCDETTMDNHL